MRLTYPRPPLAPIVAVPLTAPAKAVLGKLVNWAFVAENLDGNGIARADQAMAARMSLIATKAKHTELSATP